MSQTPDLTADLGGAPITTNLTYHEESLNQDDYSYSSLSGWKTKMAVAFLFAVILLSIMTYYMSFGVIPKFPWLK